MIARYTVFFDLFYSIYNEIQNGMVRFVNPLTLDY